MTVLIGTLFIVYILFETLSMASNGLTARRLAREAIPFNRFRDTASTTVMLIGDSTAVGTGAQNVSQSIASRLAIDYPAVNIINNGINGIDTNDLLAIIDKHPLWQADILLIHIGGIDIIGLRSLKRTRNNILKILKKARAISPRIILFSTQNVGSIPYLHFPISYIFSWRTRQIRNFILKKSTKGDFIYLDLYTDRAHDPFLKNPQRYFSADQIHPSGAGYAIWYTKLKTILIKNHWDIILTKEAQTTKNDI